MWGEMEWARSWGNSEGGSRGAHQDKRCRPSSLLSFLPYHFSREKAGKEVMVDNSWILYSPPTPIFKWRGWMITDVSSNLEILCSMMYLFQDPPGWCGFPEQRELLGDFGERRWVENWEQLAGIQETWLSPTTWGTAGSQPTSPSSELTQNKDKGWWMAWW